MFFESSSEVRMFLLKNYLLTEVVNVMGILYWLSSDCLAPIVFKNLSCDDVCQCPWILLFSPLQFQYVICLTILLSF